MSATQRHHHFRSLMGFGTRLCLLALAMLCAHTNTAWAHKPSDSYLTLTARDQGVVDAQWHIALRDLDAELQLDANDDGQLTWGEVRKRWPDIERFARPHLSLLVDAQACTSGDVAAPALIEHTDGQYAVLSWRLQCPLAPGQPWTQATLDYRLFALSDPTHRGIVHWRSQAAGSSTATSGGTVVLGVQRPQHRLTWDGLQGAAPAATTPASSSASSSQPAPDVPVLAPPVAAAAPEAHAAFWPSLLRFVKDGIDHIAAGTDHILFLVSLLLVSVWRREGSPRWWPLTAGWQARADWRSALGEVLKLVTAFTVAHSITLGLAAFGVLSPPSRWVESLIALSVLVAALDNLLPLLRGPRWAVVFGFGLVHGFGFAGALQDLGLSRSELAAPLLGFNIGVELGQLALVAVTLPLACWLRGTTVYRRVFVGAGSTFIALMALIWLIERVMDITLLGWGG